MPVDDTTWYIAKEWERSWIYTWGMSCSSGLVGRHLLANRVARETHTAGIAFLCPLSMWCSELTHHTHGTRELDAPMHARAIVKSKEKNSRSNLRARYTLTTARGVR
jgi:hypothetical protein